jgi:hypothetical protein
VLRAQVGSAGSATSAPRNGRTCHDGVVPGVAPATTAPSEVPDARRLGHAAAALGNDLVTDAALDDLYEAFLDRVRLEVLRTYGAEGSQR